MHCKKAKVQNHQVLIQWLLIFENGQVNHYLWQLFNMCFENGMIPSQLNRIIIRPIPKKGEILKYL